MEKPRRQVDGSDKIWIAVMGPDTPPLGERTNVEALTQGQVAATVAASWDSTIDHLHRRRHRPSRT